MSPLPLGYTKSSAVSFNINSGNIDFIDNPEDIATIPVYRLERNIDFVLVFGDGRENLYRGLEISYINGTLTWSKIN